MSGAFKCISEPSYGKIKQLYRTGIISRQIYDELEDADNYNKLFEVLQKSFGTQNIYDKVWKNLKEKWQWDRDDKKSCTVFNQWQSWLIEKLLRNDGVYTRENLLDEMTQQQINLHVGQLEEWGLIVSIQTKRNCGNRIIYILNPNIIREVRKSGNL